MELRLWLSLLSARIVFLVTVIKLLITKKNLGLYPSWKTTYSLWWGHVIILTGLFDNILRPRSRHCETVFLSVVSFSVIFRLLIINLWRELLKYYVIHSFKYLQNNWIELDFTQFSETLNGTQCPGFGQAYEGTGRKKILMYR